MILALQIAFCHSLIISPGYIPIYTVSIDLDKTFLFENLSEAITCLQNFISAENEF